MESRPTAGEGGAGVGRVGGRGRQGPGAAGPCGGAGGFGGRTFLVGVTAPSELLLVARRTLRRLLSVSASRLFITARQSAAMLPGGGWAALWPSAVLQNGSGGGRPGCHAFRGSVSAGWQRSMGRCPAFKAPALQRDRPLRPPINASLQAPAPRPCPRATNHPSSSGSRIMQAQASKIARFEGMKGVTARPAGRVCAAAPRASRRAAVKVEAQ